MRRRWYYFKRMLQADRLFVVQMIGNIAGGLRYAGRRIALASGFAAVLYLGRDLCADQLKEAYENYAVRIADDVVRGFLPAWKEDENTAFFLESRKRGGGRRIKEHEEVSGIENENEALRAERVAGNGEKSINENENGSVESENQENGPNRNKDTMSAGLLAAGVLNTENSGIILEKLNDYDYMMKKIYNVHPTTTADRDLMQAEGFLAMDLSIEKHSDVPQILIYHTHSQETYADYPENPEADLIHLGEHLAKLLREKGYNVYHDESVYDYRNGKLDRSAAYTYALDGIMGLLQKYPSI